MDVRESAGQRHEKKTAVRLLETVERIVLFFFNPSAGVANDLMALKNEGKYEDFY